MCDGYRIRRYWAKGSPILVLASGDGPTFLDEMVDSPKGSNDARVLVNVAKRVTDNGTDWAKKTGTLKPLRGVGGHLAVFELKSRGTVMRFAAYIHDDERRTPVYLFRFKGHQGKDSNLPRPVKERAQRLAEAARECMEGEKWQE